MIISASRRTDIPAFYGEWFMNRIREGEVLTANPYDRRKISRLPLTPSHVDAIVFWTKNPTPFLKHLDELDKRGFIYYFLFTVNPYDKSLEKGVDFKKNILNTFKVLSKRVGKERVIWRYDPILFTEKITEEYHKKWFPRLAEILSHYTEKCIFSFLHDYDKVKRNMPSDLRLPSYEEKERVTELIVRTCQQWNLIPGTCCQELSHRDLAQSSCIDKLLLERILKTPLKGKKDSGQRDLCSCFQSRDIGTYNTCFHNCSYCYANEKDVTRIHYDPLSPLLCTSLEGDETVSDSKQSCSLKDSATQRLLF